MCCVLELVQPGYRPRPCQRKWFPPESSESRESSVPAWRHGKRELWSADLVFPWEDSGLRKPVVLSVRFDNSLGRRAGSLEANKGLAALVHRFKLLTASI